MSIFSRLLLGAACVVGMASSALPAQAGEVHDRVVEQRARISAGARDGQLSPREYRRDERRVDRIDRARRRDLVRHGGRLTPGEESRLNQRLDGSSGQIYRTRHN